MLVWLGKGFIEEVECIVDFENAKDRSASEKKIQNGKDDDDWSAGLFAEIFEEGEEAIEGNASNQKGEMEDWQDIGLDNQIDKITESTGGNEG